MKLALTYTNKDLAGVEITLNRSGQTLVVHGHLSSTLKIPIVSTYNPIHIFQQGSFSLQELYEPGEFVITPSQQNDNKILLVGRIWGASKGSIALIQDYSSAKILKLSKSPRYTMGCLSIISIFSPQNILLFHANGTKMQNNNPLPYDVYTQYIHTGSDLIKEEFEGDEYRCLHHIN